jgi:hypothetical protein
MSELKFGQQGVSFLIGRLIVHQVCDVSAHDGQIGQFSVEPKGTAKFSDCLFERLKEQR